jgi:glucose/arabinose dehydrogenase
MRRSVGLALATALLCAAPAPAAPRLTPVGTFDQPVYVTAPPGDPHRLFVVEKKGTIRVMVDGGAPKTFLDIRGEVDTQGEEGLLSMAFAPDYVRSGRFFIYFTAFRPGDAAGNVIRVDELHRSAGDPDIADTARRRTLLAIEHPSFSNHSGGQLQTGPDGLLYAGTGDGGSGNDPPNNAQNTSALLGKLLRIDPTPSATRPYSIPAGNPFADGRDGAPEVYAYGLRNPWRFTFDRATGDLAIGDVGQNAIEEIDFSPRGQDVGANYGWRCREGSVPTPGVTPPCTPSGNYVPPVFEYVRSTGGCAVTGGYVVRDLGLPSLLGRYVYADYCGARLRSLVLDTPRASEDRDEGLPVASPVSFGEDACGHVYVTSLSGAVQRIDEEPFTPCSQVLHDSTPPALRLERARRQRLIANRYVSVAVRCSEDCALTTATSIRARSGGATKRFSLAARSLTAPAGQRVRMRLAIPGKTRRRLAASMRAGAQPLARIVVTARDTAGNVSRRRVNVRAIG